MTLPWIDRRAPPDSTEQRTRVSKTKKRHASGVLMVRKADRMNAENVERVKGADETRATVLDALGRAGGKTKGRVSRKPMLAAMLRDLGDVETEAQKVTATVH
jgi:hypothetical protein